jgi:hypothetical protein
MPGGTRKKDVLKLHCGTREAERRRSADVGLLGISWTTVALAEREGIEPST